MKSDTFFTIVLGIIAGVLFTTFYAVSKLTISVDKHIEQINTIDSLEYVIDSLQDENIELIYQLENN